MTTTNDMIDKMIRESIRDNETIDKALRMVNKLTENIEFMKYDCDAEVYEQLLKIADVLGR